MPNKDRPNVVLVSMDATRADHLSCYGHERLTSPNLDRLAERAVLYERCISPACWTLPSHASMFTGLYPSQHGTHFGNQALSARFSTLAEALRSEGYQTCGFCANAWLDRSFGFGRGFDTYRLRSSITEAVLRLGKAGRLAAKAFEKLYLSKGGRTSRSTIRWIRQWFSKVRTRGRPFFLFALFSDPHLPHSVHAGARRFLGPDAAKASRILQDPHRFIVNGSAMTEWECDLISRRYDSQIACMDERIGELLDILGHNCSLEDTLIIVTSDHGENLGDHGLMAHQYCLYETLIHVPLIIHFPSSRGLRGVTVPGLVQTHEIFATVLDAAGVDRRSLPNDSTGRVLLPATVSTEPIPFAISEELFPNLRRIRRVFPNFDCTRFERQLRSLRTDRYKFIWASDGSNELYDLEKDPGETRNLCAVEPERARSMEAQLEAWLASIRPYEGPASEVQCDEIVAERLKGFGYL